MKNRKKASELLKSLFSFNKPPVFTRRGKGEPFLIPFDEAAKSRFHKIASSTYVDKENLEKVWRLEYLDGKPYIVAIDASPILKKDYDVLPAGSGVMIYQGNLVIKKVQLPEFSDPVGVARELKRKAQELSHLPPDMLVDVLEREAFLLASRFLKSSSLNKVVKAKTENPFKPRELFLKAMKGDAKALADLYESIVKGVSAKNLVSLFDDMINVVKSTPELQKYLLSLILGTAATKKDLSHKEKEKIKRVRRAPVNLPGVGLSTVIPDETSSWLPSPISETPSFTEEAPSEEVGEELWSISSLNKFKKLGSPARRPRKSPEPSEVAGEDLRKFAIELSRVLGQLNSQFRKIFSTGKTFSKALTDLLGGGLSATEKTKLEETLVEELSDKIPFNINVPAYEVLSKLLAVNDKLKKLEGLQATHFIDISSPRVSDLYNKLRDLLFEILRTSTEVSSVLGGVLSQVSTNVPIVTYYTSETGEPISTEVSPKQVTETGGTFRVRPEFSTTSFTVPFHLIQEFLKKVPKESELYTALSGLRNTLFKLDSLFSYSTFSPSFSLVKTYVKLHPNIFKQWEQQIAQTLEEELPRSLKDIASLRNVKKLIKDVNFRKEALEKISKVNPQLASRLVRWISTYLGLHDVTKGKISLSNEIRNIEKLIMDFLQKNPDDNLRELSRLLLTSLENLPPSLIKKAALSPQNIISLLAKFFNQLEALDTLLDAFLSIVPTSTSPSFYPTSSPPQEFALAASFKTAQEPPKSLVEKGVVNPSIASILAFEVYANALFRVFENAGLSRERLVERLKEALPTDPALGAAREAAISALDKLSFPELVKLLLSTSLPFAAKHKVDINLYAPPRSEGEVVITTGEPPETPTVSNIRDFLKQLGLSEAFVKSLSDGLKKLKGEIYVNPVNKTTELTLKLGPLGVNLKRLYKELLPSLYKTKIYEKAPTPVIPSPFSYSSKELEELLAPLKLTTTASAADVLQELANNIDKPEVLRNAAKWPYVLYKVYGVTKDTIDDVLEEAKVSPEKISEIKKKIDLLLISSPEAAKKQEKKLLDLALGTPSIGITVPELIKKIERVKKEKGNVVLQHILKLSGLDMVKDFADLLQKDQIDEREFTKIFYRLPTKSRFLFLQLLEEPPSLEGEEGVKVLEKNIYYITLKKLLKAVDDAATRLFEVVKRKIEKKIEGKTEEEQRKILEKIMEIVDGFRPKILEVLLSTIALGRNTVLSFTKEMSSFEDPIKLDAFISKHKDALEKIRIALAQGTLSPEIAVSALTYDILKEVEEQTGLVQIKE